MKPLSAGTHAPDFELSSNTAKRIKLSDFRGKPVILAFYPADFHPVCNVQLALYNEVLPEFEKFGAQILAISVDGRWCHSAFVEKVDFRFPLLTDFEPKGEVGRKYGAYLAEDGTEARALFVIDAEGVIRWSYLSHVDVNPGADGILNALDRLPGAKVSTNEGAPE